VTAADVDGTLDLHRVYATCREDLRRYFQRRVDLDGLVEDLLQEVFQRLAARGSRALLTPFWRSYVFGVARRVVADYWRGRYKEQAAWAAAHELGELRADSHMAAVVTERVRDALLSLPPLYREILELRFEHDMSYAEISATLGIPIGTVRSRLHHALRRLRVAMDADQDNSPRITQ